MEHVPCATKAVLSRQGFPQMLTLPGAHIPLSDLSLMSLLREPARITCGANLVGLWNETQTLVTFLAYVEILFDFALFSRDFVITDLELSIPYKDIQILLTN